MLARSSELGLLGHIVDLLAHLSERGVNALAFRLDVLGDRVLDDHARLVEDRFALGHSGDELEAGQAQRPGAPEPASTGAVDQPRGADHFGQHHRHGLERLDLHVLVAARIGVLDREDSDRGLEPDDWNARKAVEPLLACFRTVGEGRVLRCLGEVEDSALACDRADEAFAHPQPGYVNRLLAQAVSREQLEIIFTQQIDRADIAVHRLSDEIDDAVELALRRAALRHDLVETRQDLASGSGSSRSHALRLSDAPPPCHAKRWASGRSEARSDAPGQAASFTSKVTFQSPTRPST